MNNNFEKYLGIANHDIQMANTSQELKSYVASILYENDKKVEEIERLNNIINKARRKLGEHKYYLTPTEEQNKENEIITEEVYQILHENLYELKELKDSD